MQHNSFMNENSVFLFFTKFPNDLIDETHGHHGYHPANIYTNKNTPINVKQCFFF